MDAVLRASAIYVSLFVLMRVSGKRTFAQITPFDFVLLLIIGEATQQGLLGNDFSVTNALIVISTLIVLDVAVSEIQRRSQRVAKVVEGTPVILVDHGRPVDEHMRRARVDEMDIMERARETQGLERMEQIKYAVLERSGAISVIPNSG